MSVCKVLSIGKGKPTNVLSRFLKEEPDVQKSMRSFLRASLIEAASAGNGYVLVAEGSCHGMVFALEGDKPYLMQSYGLDMVPDVAIQRTLNLVFSGELRDVLGGRWKKKN